MQPVTPVSSGTKTSSRNRKTRELLHSVVSSTTEKGTFKKTFTSQQKGPKLRPWKEVYGSLSSRGKSDDSCSTLANGERILEEITNSTSVRRHSTLKCHPGDCLESANKPLSPRVLDMKIKTRKPTSVSQNIQNLTSTRKADRNLLKHGDIKGPNFWGAQSMLSSHSVSNHARGHSTVAPISLKNFATAESGFGLKLLDKDEASGILQSISYWLTQIQLAEVAEKHHVSVGLFRLSLQSGAEPAKQILESMKQYKQRHNAVATSIEDILLDFETGTFSHNGNLSVNYLEASGSLAAKGGKTVVGNKENTVNQDECSEAFGSLAAKGGKTSVEGNPLTQESFFAVSSSGKSERLCESKCNHDGIEDLSQKEVHDEVNEGQAFSEKLKNIDDKAVEKKENERKVNLNEQKCSSVQVADEGERCSSECGRLSLNHSNREGDTDSCLSATFGNKCIEMRKQTCDTADLTSTTFVHQELLQSNILMSTSKKLSSVKLGVGVPGGHLQRRLGNEKSSSQSLVDKSVAPLRRTPRQVSALKSSDPSFKRIGTKEAKRLTSELADRKPSGSKDSYPSNQGFIGRSERENQEDDTLNICKVSHDFSCKATKFVTNMDVDSLMKEVVSCLVPSSMNDIISGVKEVDSVCESQHSENQQIDEFVDVSAMSQISYAKAGEPVENMNVDSLMKAASSIMPKSTKDDGGKELECSPEPQLQKDKNLNDFVDTPKMSHIHSGKATELVKNMDVDSLMEEVVSCIILSSTNDKGKEMDFSPNPEYLQNQNMVECVSTGLVSADDTREHSLAMKIEENDALESEGIETDQPLNFTTTSAHTEAEKHSCKSHAESSEQSPSLSHLQSDDIRINSEGIQKKLSEINANCITETLLTDNTELKMAGNQNDTKSNLDMAAVEKNKATGSPVFSKPVLEKQGFQSMESNFGSASHTMELRNKNATSALAVQEISSISGTVLSPLTNDGNLFIEERETGSDAEVLQSSSYITCTPTVTCGKVNTLLANSVRRSTRSKTRASHITEAERTPNAELKVPEAERESSHDTMLETIASVLTKENKHKGRRTPAKNVHPKPPAKATCSKSSKCIEDQEKNQQGKAKDNPTGLHTPKVDTYRCYQRSPSIASVKGKEWVPKSVDRLCKSSVSLEGGHEKETVDLSAARKSSYKSEYKRSGTISETKRRGFRKSDEFQRSAIMNIAKNLEIELGSEIILKEKEQKEEQTESHEYHPGDGALNVKGTERAQGTPGSVRRSARLQRMA